MIWIWRTQKDHPLLFSNHSLHTQPPSLLNFDAISKADLILHADMMVTPGYSPDLAAFPSKIAIP